MFRRKKPVRVTSLTTSKDHQKAAKKSLRMPDKPEPKDTTASVQADRDMLIGILETLSQSRHIDEYLERLIEQVRNYSGCRCVGIRLLDNDGDIPYVAYTAFSREFYEIEDHLSLKSDRCFCINVIKENTNPRLPFYTDGGSFLTNGMTKLLASVPEEAKGRTRNACNQYGYESVALVPMRHEDRILGLIHLADENENKIPVEKVRFLEQVGVYIGEAMHTFVVKEMLQKSEQRYRDLYEEAPSAYFLVGVDGHIKQANRNAAELLGYSLDELTGKPVFNLYADTPNGKAKAQKVFQRFLAGEEIRGDELEMCRADGSTVWVSLSARPIRDKEGHVVASRSTLVDITERKKLDQLKDDFIGLVSHELRSPLTVITGAVNTALTEAERLSPEETRQLLKDAALEAESLSHLLGNLMELSRVQADRLLLFAEPISVKKVIQGTIEEIKRQSSAHQFVVNVPRELPPVYADELRMERILYNLLENAVKYSPQGGEIRVFVKPGDEHLVIGVSDQGIGISRADQAKLFEPFQRLEDSRPDRVNGAGLGLSVCRKLVEAHGGRIWVESKPGKGSTFFFTLPLSHS